MITVVQKQFAPMFDLKVEENGCEFDHLFKSNEEFSVGNIKATV